MCYSCLLEERFSFLPGMGFGVGVIFGVGFWILFSITGHDGVLIPISEDYSVPVIIVHHWVSFHLFKGFKVFLGGQLYQENSVCLRY